MRPTLFLGEYTAHEKAAYTNKSVPFQDIGKERAISTDNTIMEFQRSSGVLLHVTSLPSLGGIGDLGPAAHEFVEFLAAAKQHVWQVLPLSPTGYGNSPYAGTSAFAGNPFLISLEFLSQWGWIAPERITHQAGQSGAVNFEEIEWRKVKLLYEAAGNFLDRGPLGPKHEPALAAQWEQYSEFCKLEASWLADYALYAELRRQFSTGAWTVWPEPLRRREPKALAHANATHARRVAEEQALQFAFSVQWNNLRKAAAEKHIRILGDVAIFVSMDSADVWVHPELFELDKEFQPERIAGVPPDYFSKTGQRWGNPLYRWDVLAEQGFKWWIDRVRRACEIYDIIRLDHFRGFEAYWAIPAAEETAVNGEWVKAPGLELFRALEKALGSLPLVAEDLGVITDEVNALRHELKLPGMRVMQFGFSNPGAHIHLPHRFTTDTVAYTGTHDNNTTLGWWKTVDKVERAAVEAYVGPCKSPVWPLIRSLETSVAQVAVVPAQDLLELGAEARMNTPAVAENNWHWRAPEGCWTPELAAKMAAMVEATDRDKDPLPPAVVNL
jgi:4-alpha-glucanotransferase